jgi:CubicO group peptidase (beta-lactamase class C family)
MAFGGVNLTARDFAKLGELYRNGGVWQGMQVVPKNWITASVTPDAPHLMAGKTEISDHSLPLGYGYQWWIPDGDRGEFSAIGVYNQLVYVDPSRGIVIVKLSANRTYGMSPYESTNREAETIEFLRAIAARFD